MSDQTQLLKRCREGEISAVERLVQTFQQPLFHLAYSLLLDVDDAIRAVQEGLLSAIYTPGRRRADEPFDIWMGALTIRACQDLMAHHALSQVFHKKENILEPNGPTPFTSTDKASLSAPGSRSDEEIIWSAYQKLSNEQRIPLALRYFHNYSTDQIVRLLRVGKSTVITRLGSARDHLLHSLYPEVSGAHSSAAEIDSTTIRHDQARYLLQSAEDNPLPSLEWVPLQQHLDQCEDCRSYRNRLQGLERRLQQILRPQLEAVASAPAINPEKLLQRQRTGLRRRNTLVSLGKFVGTILTLAIGISLAYAMFLPPPGPNVNVLSPESMTQAVSTPSPTPTVALAVPFRTTILFESNRDGNSEIYIIDPNGLASNLTQDPAEDTFPAWSPDGEWIAFLSNRTGKNEVWVMRVSGTQLYQITSGSGIDWLGPISWSPDGKRLALIGKWAGDQSTPWVYLVALDNSTPPIRLSFTRGALNPLWAPQGNWLAFEQVIDGRNQLFATRVDLVNKINLTSGSSIGINQNQIYQIPGSGFDWTPSGGGLIYIKDGPFIPLKNNQQTQLQRQLTPQPNAVSEVQISAYSKEQGVTGNYTALESSSIDSPVVGASSSPGALMAYFQMDPTSCHGEGWYRLNIAKRGEAVNTFNQPTPSAVPMAMPGICAALPLTNSAWTPDGRWLIVDAMLGSESKPALYALDVIKSQSDLFYDKTAQLVIVRLTEPTGNDRFPQVRPQKALLGIVPKPGSAIEPQPSLPPSVASGASGEIIFTSAQSGNPEVYSIHPDGSTKRGLTFTQSANNLLAVSRSGNGKIAFLSNRGNVKVGMGEIFVMDANGDHVQQMTGTVNDQRPSTPLYYHEPLAWSLDGSLLAAQLLAEDGPYLVILPADPSLGEPNRYIHLENEAYTAPFFTPDGSAVILFSMASRGEVGSVNMLTIPVNVEIDSQEVQNTSLPKLGRAVKILDSAFIYNTTEIAILVSESTDSNHEIPLELYASPLYAQNWRLVATFRQIPGTSDPQMQAVPGKDEVLIRFDSFDDSQYKTSFTLVNLEAAPLIDLLKSEDHVYSQILSPDGRWLVYSSETGVWLLDIDGAVAGNYQQTKISDEGFLRIDWAP